MPATKKTAAKRPAVKKPAAKRPPTNAKLASLLAVMADPDVESEAYFTASAAVQAILTKGLPSGLDPIVVRDVVVQVAPGGYTLGRMLRNVGSAYDAEIIEGARLRRGRVGIGFAFELELIVTLAAARGATILDAWNLLLRAERAVDRSAETNAPEAPTREMVLEVKRLMAPWLEEGAREATLKLAEEELPPTRGGSGKTTWINPVQCDEEWALLIACACDPSARTRALVASRKKLGQRFDEPLRSVFASVLELCATVA